MTNNLPVGNTKFAEEEFVMVLARRVTFKKKGVHAFLDHEVKKIRESSVWENLRIAISIRALGCVEAQNIDALIFARDHADRVVEAEQLKMAVRLSEFRPGGGEYPKLRKVYV